jgi:hypothetical protein
MGVVHVGWSTLDKRVREFSSAAASALTPKEFEAVAAATEEQTAQLLAHVVSGGAGGGALCSGRNKELRAHGRGRVVQTDAVEGGECNTRVHVTVLVW